MNKVIFFLLLLTSFSTNAAVNRNIWDLQYLPEAGTIYGESTFTFVDGEADVRSPIPDSEISGQTFTQRIGYSLLDKLSFEGAITRQ